MEADFSGWATKAGLKCSDGRTIMPGAFQHQDTQQVPLVWQHGHNDPDNVLGHAILEHREDGVYCYGFFNETAKAQQAQKLLEHKDISMLSIWANDLIERSKRVVHGAIREVSLVLSGANPGALIENVTLRHSDGGEEVLDEEAIIHTGLAIENVLHAVDTSAAVADPKTAGADDEAEENDLTIQDVYDSMTPEQQQVTHFLIGQALAEDEAADAVDGGDDNEGDASAKHGNLDGDDAGDSNNTKEGNEMKHNVFESNDDDTNTPVLSHEDKAGIMQSAIRLGSLKAAVEAYAEEHLEHGVDNISVLFPEAVATSQDPNFLSRRIEWVATLLGAVNKSPFSRIKTLNADITIDEARAKGYVKGAMKKEEFFSVSKRVTTPTTIYKKQKMDRDDVVDITDFDVVTWLKNEMRLMLDEELARAILVGDGRDISDADKISESNIRPIAKEHELFATTVSVNIRDASSSADEIVDAVIANRWQYKGTGMPTLFTSETVLASFFLVKDSLGRRIYQTVQDIASVLRVATVVPCEALEINGAIGQDANLLGVIVNPVDYTVGATAGGQVSMFDFFDIDYNQQKYLIETRCCGALTRLKSALILKQTAHSTDAAVVPNAPTFVASTGVVTIVATTGVTYIDDATGATLATGAQTAIPAYSTQTITAVADSTHFIPSDSSATWTFTRDA